MTSINNIIEQFIHEFLYIDCWMLFAAILRNTKNEKLWHNDCDMGHPSSTKEVALIYASTVLSICMYNDCDMGHPSSTKEVALIYASTVLSICMYMTWFHTKYIVMN